MDKPTTCPNHGICPECKAHAECQKDAIKTDHATSKTSRQEIVFKTIYETCGACPLNPGKK